MADMYRFLLRMPVEMHDEFVRRAAENDRTVAAEMRRALRWYLATVKDGDQ